MMLERLPPVNFPTVTTAGASAMFDLARHDRLEAGDDLRADDDRVDAAPRHRAVRLPAA